MRANEILETCLYVDDLDEAERFYGEILGLEFVSRQNDRHVFWKCGNRMLLLFDPTRGAGVRVGDAPSRLPGNRARGVCGPRQRDCGMDVASENARRDHRTYRGMATGWASVYFRDPAGNSLELASPKIWGLDERLTLP